MNAIPIEEQNRAIEEAIEELGVTEVMRRQAHKLRMVGAVEEARKIECAYLNGEEVSIDDAESEEEQESDELDEESNETWDEESDGEMEEEEDGEMENGQEMDASHRSDGDPHFSRQDPS